MRRRREPITVAPRPFVLCRCSSGELRSGEAEMRNDEPLARLQDCLQAVYDAAWQIFGSVGPEERALFHQSLVSVSDAWRAFEAGLDEGQCAQSAELTASLVARIGDDLFYGRGATDEAIAVFRRRPIDCAASLGIAKRHHRSVSAGQRPPAGTCATVCRASGRDRPESSTGRYLYSFPHGRLTDGDWHAASARRIASLNDESPGSRVRSAAPGR